MTHLLSAASVRLLNAQQGARTDLEEPRDKNVPKSEADEKQQARTRALGRAVE